jgi:alcohol dehydrogenase
MNTGLNSSASFSFILPTRIEYGIGSHRKIPDFLQEAGVRRILIITDPGVAKLSWFTQLKARLTQRDYEVEVFSGVEPNPKDRNVEEAAEAARKVKADCLLAVGGGSPIDCAKVVSILAVYGGKPRDYEDPSRIGPHPLPLIAVPTTAGTGSEVTFGAVITDTKARFKFTVKSPLLAPKIALLDPELTLSMPPSLTASTGMDALTHAIEAYTSRASEPLADACALYAAELLLSYLPRVVQQGTDIEARSAVLLGSLLAGIAFSHSDVGAVHCIAEALGGMYDLPHGVCNAVCLPYVMEYCLESNILRYARLGQAMGVYSTPPTGVSIPKSSPTAPDTRGIRETQESVRRRAQATVHLVKDLARQVGLPDFRSFAVPESDFPLIAEKAAANGSNKDNVPILTQEDYLRILKRLQGGG